MEPNCNKCKHHYVTFNQHTPKGCKAYQIQSKQLPSIVVKQANDGASCLAFELKPHLKKTTTGKDLNDSKYW